MSFYKRPSWTITHLPSSMMSNSSQSRLAMLRLSDLLITAAMKDVQHNSSSDAPLIPSYVWSQLGRLPLRYADCSVELAIENKSAAGNICKPCASEVSIAYKRANPMRSMFLSAKARASKKGLEFSITQDFLESIDSDVCPYLRIPIKFHTTGRGSGKACHDQKSLDRIDSSKGYTEENVVICSWMANNMLSCFSAKEMAQVPDLKPITDRFFTLLNPTK